MRKVHKLRITWFNPTRGEGGKLLALCGFKSESCILSAKSQKVTCKRCLKIMGQK